MTGTEKLVACHRSKRSAQAQVAALFASEAKEQEMAEEVAQVDGVENKCCGGENCSDEKHSTACEVEDGPYVPGGVISFADLDKVLDAEEAVCDMKTAAEQFKGLVNNIIWSDDVEDKAAAITKLSNEFAARIKGETTIVNDRYSVAQGLSAKKVALDKIHSTGEQACAYCDIAITPDNHSGWEVFVESGDATQPVCESCDISVLAREQEKKEAALVSRITEAVKGWFGKEEKPAEKSELMLWKQEDSRYRWLAVFSNKYRDDDRPPEILSEAAHKDFVKAVEEGDWPYPELQHWHTHGTRWGMTDWIGYDDGIGFILASGLVDEGHEVEAEAIMAIGKEIKISHGMPRVEIERDADDDTIITRYRTAEISDLPGWAAANPLTGFNIFGQEVKTMQDEIKKYLQEVGMTSERIAELETELEGTAKQASEEREFKETEPKPVVQQAEGDEPAPEGDVEKDAVLTKEEIAEAIVAAVEPATAKAIEPLVEHMEALGKRLKKLERSDVEKVTEQAEATPAASLADLIHARTVGADEARVDGRTSLAKDGPDETEPVANTPNVSGISFIDQMLAPKSEEAVQ